MRLLWTVLPGVLLVSYALWEVFQDLFHPTKAGSLSNYVARMLFALFRRKRSLLSLAGPLSLVLVIACWIALLAVGFALIYWSTYPDGFQLASGHKLTNDHALLRTLYFSLQAMTSLGLGDLVPERDWARIVATVEALIGFGLLTASVSWIVLIYPALGRVRTLAKRTAMFQKAGEATGIDVISGNVETLIGDLALDVIRTRVDFIHFPIIYYFHADHRPSSLAANLPVLDEYARAGARAETPDRVRLAAAVLHAALEDLANVLADRFVTAESKDARTIFRAYAEHHLVR